MSNTKVLKKEPVKRDTNKLTGNDSKLQATLFNYKTVAAINALNRKFKKEVVSIGAGSIRD